MIYKKQDIISIHAPPRGATECRCCKSRGNSYFNSRPSARGDGGFYHRHRRHDISIHAPPRGATEMDMTVFGFETPFQFTPLREGRRRRPPICWNAIRFQFTPLREGRLLGVVEAAFTLLFQFTPLREGRPWVVQAIGGGVVYFNSRPSARGDARLASVRNDAPNFNSRPSARGDTRSKEMLIVFQRISIHAPPRGATWTIEPQDERKLISIHAPPRGATPSFRARSPS